MTVAEAPFSYLIVRISRITRSQAGVVILAISCFILSLATA